MIRRGLAAVLLAAGVSVLPACGVYADSNGQTCLIILAIPICSTGS